MEKITEEELQRCEGHMDGPLTVSEPNRKTGDGFMIRNDNGRIVAEVFTTGAAMFRPLEAADAELFALSPRLLSAYREVVKENEALKTDVENLIVNGRELVKENEELKGERDMWLEQAKKNQREITQSQASERELYEALKLARRHGLIEQDGYAMVVKVINLQIQRYEEANPKTV